MRRHAPRGALFWLVLTKFTLLVVKFIEGVKVADSKRRLGRRLWRLREWAALRCAGGADCAVAVRRAAKVRARAQFAAWMTRGDGGSKNKWIVC